MMAPATGHAPRRAFGVGTRTWCITRLQICAKRANLHVVSKIEQGRYNMDGIPHIRLFSRGDRLYVQAQQIWIILVAFVMHSKRNPKRPEKMTYGDLAKAMGYPDSRAGHGLARQLGIVGEYCVRNRWPALN